MAGGSSPAFFMFASDARPLFEQSELANLIFLRPIHQAWKRSRIDRNDKDFHRNG